MNKKHFFSLFVIFFIAAGASLAALSIPKFLHSKTGQIILSPSLSATQKNFINQNLPSDLNLTADVTISAKTTLNLPQKQNYLISQIFVPITDFFSTTDNVSAHVINLKTIKSTDPNVQIIPLKKLTPTQKLLAIDDHYFLNNPAKGAIYQIFQFNGADSERVIATLQKKTIQLPAKNQILSFAQTGVTALSRRLNAVATQKSATYLSERIAPFLKEFDLTHISNEVSFAEPCSSNSSSTVLCSSPQMLDVIKAIGTDIVELTGNHLNDYGATANQSSIDQYHALKMQTFGGGKDESSAKVPLKINQKHTKITLLGYNYSTSTKANGQGANGDHPGANIYDETIATADIKAAKQRGDFIIVDIQFFECYSYPAEGVEMPSCDAPITNQRDFFRHLIDLGADLVVGTQAHQPQTYEIYNQKLIFYGLGNLFFDQIYWPGTTRSLILAHYFYKEKHLQTRIHPTIYGSDFQTKLMDQPTAQNFLQRLQQSRP